MGKERGILKDKVLKLGKVLPKDAVGKRTRIFGVTRGAYKNPAFWSVNEIPKMVKSQKTGMLIDKIEPDKVLGHAHSITLTDPRFDKMYRPKQLNTRGYKVKGGTPAYGKINTEDIELTQKAKDLLAQGKKQSYKDRYAFVDGKVKNIEELTDVRAKPDPGKGKKYKSARLNKLPLDDILDGANDYYVGQTLRNGSTRKLIGRREYNTLKKHNQLGKGKYHLATQVQLEPNGAMYYYNSPSLFLCDIASFNRKINLSHTNLSSAKATVKRTRDALDDLRRRGGKSFEGAYTINNSSGKVGKYFTNKQPNTIDSRTVLKVPPKNGTMSFLHNHPRNSSLSISDLLNTNPNSTDYVVNTTPGGSYFRGRLKQKPNPQEMIKTRQKIINKVDYEFRQLKPGKLSPKDLDRRSFIASHLVNSSLANQGVIHYRAKLTPKDKRTLDFWLNQSPKLRSIYDGNTTH